MAKFHLLFQSERITKKGNNVDPVVQSRLFFTTQWHSGKYQR